MLKFGKITHLNHAIYKSSGVKHMSICCPPPKRPGCGPGPGKVIGQRIPQPAKSGCKPRFAPNPCVPRFHDGKDTWKKYRFFSIFVCIPFIIAQAINALSHAPPHKGVCRDYEYMRVRNKKFPWGTGNESFFHNEHVNHRPGECEPPDPDCD